MEKDEPLFKVITFNIKGIFGEEGEIFWKKRRDMMAELFYFHDISIFGLQEATYQQIKDLESRLPDYAWVGVGREDGEKKGEFTPLFYLQEKFQMIDHHTFWLSEEPEQKGSLGWDAACKRIVTWARLKQRETGKSFYFFNTHLDHEGPQARKESARLLLERISLLAGDHPVVLTGDFNATPASTAYKLLCIKQSSKVLQDAHQISRKGHYGPDSTFHNFQGLENNSKTERIDYIFVKNGVKVFCHGVLCDRQEDSFLSDHFPVLAEIQI